MVDDRLTANRGQKGEGAGPIAVYEHETASDAVYRQAHLNELIQPNYTALGVQKRFLEEVCKNPFPAHGPPARGCAPPIYRPRVLLFEMPLEWLGLTYTFRYYPEDWPPCAGDYNPFHSVPTRRRGPSAPTRKPSRRAARDSEDRCSGSRLRAFVKRFATYV